MEALLAPLRRDGDVLPRGSSCQGHAGSLVGSSLPHHVPGLQSGSGSRLECPGGQAAALVCPAGSWRCPTGCGRLGVKQRIKDLLSVSVTCPSAYPLSTSHLSPLCPCLSLSSLLLNQSVSFQESAMLELYGGDQSSRKCLLSRGKPAGSAWLCWPSFSRPRGRS